MNEENPMKKWQEQTKSDIQWAKANGDFIRELAELCYQLRTVIEVYSDYAGPYAQPFIDAQLEGILGVYRREREKNEILV